MISKKIAKLGFILVGITSLSFGSIYAMETSNKMININTVYSKTTPSSSEINTNAKDQNDTSSSKGPSRASAEAKECYCKLLTQALQKYFNLTANDSAFQDITVVDENYISSSKEYSKQHILKSTDLSEEQRKEMLSSLENPSWEEYIMKGLNHAYVEIEYMSEDIVCTAYFNANTKDIISMGIDFEPKISFNAAGVVESYQHSSVKSDDNIDPTSYTDLASEYITSHQLSDITSPKLVKSKLNGEAYLLFEDTNDSSKKAIVMVNTKLNKVTGFYVKSAVNYWSKPIFEVESGRNL